jgi:hypothetical protein
VSLSLKGVKAVCEAGPTNYAFVEMLTLYHNDMSVCAAKVRTALAAKNSIGMASTSICAAATRRSPNTSS